MADKKRDTPPAADPRAGKNPGYAETNPRDKSDAHAKAPPSRPSPDEPGIDRDTDAQPDPADDTTSEKKRH